MTNVDETNVDRHGKTPAEQVAEAERSLAPSHAREAHLVDRYLEGCWTDRQATRGVLTPEAPPIVLRFDLLPATPASLARMRRRVDDINQRLRLSDIPFQLRIM